MAGKTTYLKSCAVAVYLAHLGMGVPAKSMNFTPLEVIYTSIDIKDNIEAGKSDFYCEVERVKKISKLIAFNKKSFIVFDDLFKGTNPGFNFEVQQRMND